MQEDASGDKLGSHTLGIVLLLLFKATFYFFSAPSCLCISYSHSAPVRFLSDSSYPTSSRPPLLFLIIRTLPSYWELALEFQPALPFL